MGEYASESSYFQWALPVAWQLGPAKKSAQPLVKKTVVFPLQCLYGFHYVWRLDDNHLYIQMAKARKPKNASNLPL